MSETRKHLIGNKFRVGKTPWNKGKKGVQIAWNKGKYGYMQGSTNGMFKDGLSANNYLGRKIKEARREKPESCEICCNKSTYIDFDHDHSTGIFRGWICRRCNLVLGMVKDDRRLLRLLAEYLDINDELTRPKVIINLDVILNNDSH